MKGFMITVDGIIALIVALSVFVIINSTFMSAQPSALSDIQLKKFSMDSLTILEKSGMLARAVQYNSSAEIVYFTNTEFPSTCMRINISRADGYALSAARDGCTSEGKNFFIARRTFTDGSNFYIAELHAWGR